MTEGSDDRAVLTLTVWPHDGELLGLIRWRPSLAAGTEVLASARGIEEIVAVISLRLREHGVADAPG